MSGTMASADGLNIDLFAKRLPLAGQKGMFNEFIDSQSAGG